MRRATLAALLYLGGVGLPLGGWLQAGLDEARRGEQARIERARAATDQSVRAGAERLAARLEGLRAAEERRPYYHYQNLFHDPLGASLGPSVVPSPLASEPADPLIEAYFQLDDTGRLTLPTLNDEVSGLPAPSDAERQRAVREQLRGHLAELGPLPGADNQGFDNNKRSQPMRLDAEAYALNNQANEVYLDLKQARRPVLQAQKRAVEIATDEVRWRRIELGRQPRLVGLRQVQTPDGARAQGFLVSHEVARSTAALPGAWLLGQAPSSPAPAAWAAVGATGLWLAVERAGEAAALAEAEAERRRFLGLFGLVALVVAATGAVVVLVVARSEALAAERSRFAAAAAHELRTPLAGLRMYAEMLAEGLGEPERHRDYAQRVALEAERLGRVVGNVLGFTRLERTSLSVQPRPGDLASFVEEAALRRMPWAEAMGVALDLSIESTPEASFDPDAMTQVLLNLIDNAEKYGRIAADRGIVVATRQADGGAELAVIDHGPGVPPELLPRLFQPFARGSDPDSPPGLGLGLSLAHALCKAQGGRLRYEPTPGGGATFCVWLPRSAAPPGSQRRAPAGDG